MVLVKECEKKEMILLMFTRTILNQLPTNGTTGVPSDQSAAHVLGNSAWQFCVMFFGSALLGVIFALISALVSNNYISVPYWCLLVLTVFETDKPATSPIIGILNVGHLCICSIFSSRRSTSLWNNGGFVLWYSHVTLYTLQSLCCDSDHCTTSFEDSCIYGWSVNYIIIPQGKICTISELMFLWFMVSVLL